MSDYDHVQRLADDDAEIEIGFPWSYAEGQATVENRESELEADDPEESA